MTLPLRCVCRVVQGLAEVPVDRPLLFVGNHQLFAPDMPLMIEQFLREKRMLLRGLAHPFVLQVSHSPPLRAARQSWARPLCCRLVMGTATPRRFCVAGVINEGATHHIPAHLQDRCSHWLTSRGTT
jgi:hypothetical protein